MYRLLEPLLQLSPPYNFKPLLTDLASVLAHTPCLASCNLHCKDLEYGAKIGFTHYNFWDGNFGIEV